MDIQTFNDIGVGDWIGAVSGPGGTPKYNKWRVVAKIDDRWGRHLLVKNAEGETDTVHSFTKVGIGWYRLED